MIYFIEFDEQGNLMHCCACPNRAIVPMVNQVKYHDARTKQPFMTADNRPASHLGHAMMPPVEIDQTTYDKINGQLEKFKWDGKQVVAR